MKKADSFIAYGLSAGAIITAVAITIYLANMELMPWMQLIVSVPLVVVVLLYGFIFSKANDGFVTFRQVFERCFYVVMIAGTVFMLWQVVSLVVFPNRMQDYLANYMMKFHDRMMAENSRYTNAHVKKSTHIVGIYIYAVSLFKQVFRTLLAGTIFAIITAAVVDTHGERIETATTDILL